MNQEKTRVLMVYRSYPSISQTYTITEADALARDCDLRIIAYTPAPLPVKNHLPFLSVNNPEGVREVIREFRPHVLHAHFLHMIPLMAELAEQAGIPFTVRPHSTETFLYLRQAGCKSGSPFNRFRSMTRAINTDACLGILVLPFFRPLLERTGIKSEKLIDCFPVVNFARFYDPSPNGDEILNVGVYCPKKKMKDFVELGKWVDRPLNLYALGDRVDSIRRYNEKQGSPINIPDYVEPEDMPKVYKRHRWLVYTACPELNTAGWPMTIAEAQAAGLGVCFPDIRPDIREFVGESGYFYKSIREVPDIISKPFPEERRAQGFEQAKKSDIQRHKTLLTDLWDRAAQAPPKIRAWNSYTLYNNIASPLKKIIRPKAPGI